MDFKIVHLSVLLSLEPGTMYLPGYWKFNNIMNYGTNKNN